MFRWWKRGSSLPQDKTILRYHKCHYISQHYGPPLLWKICIYFWIKSGWERDKRGTCFQGCVYTAEKSGKNAGFNTVVSCNSQLPISEFMAVEQVRTGLRKGTLV